MKLTNEDLNLLQEVVKNAHILYIKIVLLSEYSFRMILYSKTFLRRQQNHAICSFSNCFKRKVRVLGIMLYLKKKHVQHFSQQIRQDCYHK